MCSYIPWRFVQDLIGQRRWTSSIANSLASSPMLWRKTAAPRYTASWRRGALQMRSCASRMTG